MYIWRDTEVSMSSKWSIFSNLPQTHRPSFDHFNHMVKNITYQTSHYAIYPHILSFFLGPYILLKTSFQEFSNYVRICNVI